jgi:hypothetical protein
MPVSILSTSSLNTAICVAAPGSESTIAKFSSSLSIVSPIFRSTSQSLLTALQPTYRNTSNYPLNTVGRKLIPDLEAIHVSVLGVCWPRSSLRPISLGNSKSAKRIGVFFIQNKHHLLTGQVNIFPNFGWCSALVCYEKNCDLVAFRWQLEAALLHFTDNAAHRARLENIRCLMGIRQARLSDSLSTMINRKVRLKTGQDVR